MKIIIKLFSLQAAYIEKMKEDPAVSQYLVPKDILIKFISAYGRGEKPDYDLLYKN